MKQLKNSDFNLEKKEKILLKDIILFYIETTIDIASYPIDDDLGLRVEEEIMRRYKIDSYWAVARLYHPVYWTLHDHLILINEYNKVVIPKKEKKLTKKKKMKLVKNIISEYKEYYKANIKKFNLGILLQ